MQSYNTNRKAPHFIKLLDSKESYLDLDQSYCNYVYNSDDCVAGDNGESPVKINPLIESNWTKIYETVKCPNFIASKLIPDNLLAFVVVKDDEDFPEENGHTVKIIDVESPELSLLIQGFENQIASIKFITNQNLLEVSDQGFNILVVLENTGTLHLYRIHVTRVRNSESDDKDYKDISLEELGMFAAECQIDEISFFESVHSVRKI